MKGTALAVLPDGREISAKQLGDYSGARPPQNPHTFADF
jgi:hypothetical protein